METAVGTHGDAGWDWDAGCDVGGAGVEFLGRKLVSMEQSVVVMHLERLRLHTLQKSIDLTPLDPSAGPTGGDGDACPAPTISLTITSAACLDFDIVAGYGVVR